MMEETIREPCTRSVRTVLREEKSPNYSGTYLLNLAIFYIINIAAEISLKM